MITEAEDILEEYNISQKVESSNNQMNLFSFENDVEKAIYNLLVVESLDIDELVEKTDYDLNTISITISMLEIK
jgi:predicted Rossmann fold nucleotide-binding protein DprA/Smf involved in DNA uptake